MSLYSLISSVLSYVFTTIIYLFIFSVIALIYADIHKMNRDEDSSAPDSDNDFDGEYDDDDEYDGDEYDNDDEYESIRTDYHGNRRVNGRGERTAVLRTVKTRRAAECAMKTYYRIGEEPTITGRGEDCDITVDNLYLSEEHFQIWYEDGVWYIADMGSKNGTQLNGKTLSKVRTLHSGDEISFGGVSFIFKEE